MAINYPDKRPLWKYGRYFCEKLPLMKQLIITAALLFGFSSTALGWGQIGHRVIGEVAENHLSPKAKKAIDEILGHESLAVVSTYMDEIRSDDDFDHTHPWHYTTIPEGETYETCEKNQKGEAVEAILRMKKILEDENAPMAEKKQALKFLVHLVGDIHQPLHVGTGTDRGGNDVKLEFFYEPSNLHRIWDSGMIDAKQYSYTELAELVDHADNTRVKNWQQGGPADWANEAMQYRDQVYDYGDKDYVSYEYMYKNWDLVKMQLEKGGIRLAGMLNEIFG